MFNKKSRYAQLPTYVVIDRRGRKVRVVPAALPPAHRLLGFHRRRQGERLDHLAAGYLDDAAGAWRILEAGDVMLPEALSEALEIPIPERGR